MEQVSIVGRSSRCNVHVRKTELAKNGKFVVLFVFTSLKPGLHCFTTTLGPFESACHFAVKLLVS